MKRKELTAYVDHGSKKAGKALHHFLKKGEPEQLHRFRVEVKKLHALITLEESVPGTLKLRQSFKPVKQLFKNAGIIRDNHLQLKLARKQQAGAGFIQQREQEMQQADLRLRKTIRHHPRRIKNTGQKLACLLRSLTNLHIELFYEQELQAIAGDLANPLSDNALHDCRKRLKVLLYNYALVCPILKLPFNEPYLEEVQTAIGDWHDNLLASENFPVLKKEDKKLRQHIRSLSNNFYDRATTTTEQALAQID